VDPLDRLRTALADQYAVQREIGRGGMALVFLARDIRHNRDVAIKVLKPEFAMAVSAERFLREIQLEARLKHPYILPLFDSGDVDGLLYYVMPYIRGESLRARLQRETQLPLDLAIRITGEIAEALTYAHEQGVVHRDVKPGNILLDESHAVLADFGIARAMSELAGDRLSESGIVVGTPEYMSPEQCTEHGNVDGRSDVYALGCVLYEMLVGEPPFTGPTAQSIVARHLQERPRSLRVVRSSVPEHVEEAIEIALAKIPADRFSTATGFHAALLHEGETVSAIRRARLTRRRKTRRWAGLAGAAVVLTLGFWKFSAPKQPNLDRNKVVLFPLSERGLPAGRAGMGYDVAVMLSAALEHAQPLRWIDGAQRLRGAATTPQEFLGIARKQRAGYYIDGTVLGSGPESTTVILRLHDTRGDSVTAQEVASSSRPGISPVQVGLDAATKLLPRLVDPGRTIDLTPLSARKPGAVALWIQGERAYRRSRFRDALAFYRRAVAEDSALAVAALKGAQAAGWENLADEAQKLVEIALRHQALLPDKQQWFARGWHAYLTGKADSAATWLRMAVSNDPEWAEGHMALGEVFYHLLPALPEALDSLAQAEFLQAAHYDSGFAPPLYHLAEIAARRGQVGETAALIERFQRFEPDSARRRQLALMYRCLGPARPDWSREAATSPMNVLQAARSLSVAGAQNVCAEAGFRALLADSAVPDFHWAAFLGVHGILMAEHRYSELVPLIDSASLIGVGRAPAVYFVDAILGAPVDTQAEAIDSAWRSRFGELYEKVSLGTRLLLVEWSAHRRDTLRVKALRAALLADTHSTAIPLRGLLDGQLALARGDTAAAAESFGTLRVDVPAEELEWELIEPLPVERLVLARYALARGDLDEAIRHAAVFDHPSPIAYLPFVAAGLDVRLEAARKMGRRDLVARYQSRLGRLQTAEGVALGLAERR
jgi:tetratricopeptide (TPR) repeat protein